MGRLDTPLTGRLLLGLLGYTALSSFLGLMSFNFFQFPSEEFMEGWTLFYRVWTMNLYADALFVLGTLIAGYVAWGLATRRRYILSFFAGFGASWVTYAVSFLSISDPAFPDWVGQNLRTLWVMTWWGIYGLAFAAGAPSILHAWMTREEERDTEGTRGFVLPPVDD